MATINLFGGSGHAKVISDLIYMQGDTVGIVYDDNPEGKEINGTKVKGATDGSINELLMVAIGANESRYLIVRRYPDAIYAKVIAPSAQISRSVQIDDGTVVMHGAIIQAESKIGKHCIINTGASVDHECIVGDFAHIAPHSTLCGNVHVGEGAFIGAGATVIPGIKIGKWATVAAGATVVSDVPDRAVVAGVPAKIIRYKD